MPTSAQAPQIVEKLLERREEPRFDGGLNGSFALSGRSGDGDKTVTVFACRIDSISAKGLVITAPAQGRIGELIWVDVPGFGITRGAIEELQPEGFILTVVANVEQRKKLASWVLSMRRRARGVAQEKRQHARSEPRDPRTMITLPDGRLMRGFVTDISKAGAAISVDCVLEPGVEVIVGRVRARVVRSLQVGFAVAFASVLELDSYETLVTGFDASPMITAQAG